MRPLRGLGWGGSIYAISVLAAAVAVVPLGLFLHPIPPDMVAHQLLLLLFLGAFTQVSALMPIRSSRGLLTVDTLPLTAAGLLIPGAGVALIAWLCTHDGRRPSEHLPFWRLASSRAKSALEHGSASLLVAAIPVTGILELPAKTVVYAAVSLLLTYSLVARMFAFIEKLPFREVLAVGLRETNVHSVVLLVFGGGILSVLLTSPTGKLMSLAVLGLLFAIRANISDAQRQREAKLQTLKLAAQALDARDRYTESHSQRVSELSLRLGQAMGLAGRDLERLGVGGILHDIGKIGIPDAILNKRGQLTQFEWAIMRRHPDLGADMILNHSQLADVAPMVRHHHERWDGTGYPAGLEGAEIPLGGRILAVADSFDTITRIRLYRRTLMTVEEAIDDVSSLSGRWYDPRVVNALRAIHGVPPLPVAEPSAPVPPRPAVPGLELLRRRPQFRRLATASGISSLGDPLTTVAVLVSAYAASHSALLVAGTYATKAVATLLLGGLLASVSDRFDRRRLIFGVELARAGTLLATPFLLGAALTWLFPVVFLLAAAEAIVSPAREAATPELVKPGELRAANAVLGAVNTSSQVIGFPVAGLILLAGRGTGPLFWLDAATFLVGGLLVISLGSIGGAASSRPLLSGALEAWRNRPARPYLLVAAIGAFFISMSLPALIALAYQLSSRGAQAYTLLELALSIGVVAGNVLVWRMGAVSSNRLMALGLAVTGALCLGITLSPSIVLTGAMLLLASIGNAWYFVANRTALQESGRHDHLGSLMATRFTLGNLTLIAGSGLGGWLVASIGPRYVYGLIGLGLSSLAVMIAFGLPREAAVALPDPPVPEQLVEVRPPAAADAALLGPLAAGPAAEVGPTC